MASQTAKINGAVSSSSSLVASEPTSQLAHRTTGSRKLTIKNEDHHVHVQPVGDDSPLPKTTTIKSHISGSLLSKRDRSHYMSTLAAGVGSGALASIVCAPLDLWRIRMQVWGDISSAKASTAFQEILEKEGWKGMFRGLGATLVTVPLFWGVYFPLYDETKFYISTNYPEYHPSVVHMGSAVFTGAVADIICNPCFVVRTRLQTQALHQIADHQSLQATGMVQTAKELYAQHGIRIFWRGMTANLIGLTHVAIQFPVYEYLKKTCRDRHADGSPETAAELLVSSGLAKMCASLLSYPHEVLRSRMMDSRAATAPSLIGTAKHILELEGYKGFYNGLSVTLLRVIPNCCMTFLSYEMIFRYCKEAFATNTR
ncbi:mitochondrial carrier protein [Nitzschia inconspicua]|uniref:Mitochondrial carrier protein n=1 Tax=Nitzschia inconspicua TaxID=303405 RepID=A0A9K3L2P2_9STRA|nr:mitochondrial carrier protein [Nitzschia inconspicua]